jgi:hypothetical protein
MMQAINRHRPEEFDPKRKSPHWGFAALSFASSSSRRRTCQGAADALLSKSSNSRDRLLSWPCL